MIVEEDKSAAKFLVKLISKTKHMHDFERVSSWINMFKAGVNMNLSEILVSLVRGWKGKKGLWNTTRQLLNPTMAPQVVGQLFGVYLPIFNFKL